jgi:transposase-like protein
MTDEEDINACPRCGSPHITVKYSAILAGDGGGYRIPAYNVECPECNATTKVVE